MNAGLSFINFTEFNKIARITNITLICFPIYRQHILILIGNAWYIAENKRNISLLLSYSSRNTSFKLFRHAGFISINFAKLYYTFEKYNLKDLIICYFLKCFFNYKTDYFSATDHFSGCNIEKLQTINPIKMFEH